MVLASAITELHIIVLLRHQKVEKSKANLYIKYFRYPSSRARPPPSYDAFFAWLPTKATLRASKNQPIMSLLSAKNKDKRARSAQTRTPDDDSTTTITSSEILATLLSFIPFFSQTVSPAPPPEIPLVSLYHPQERVPFRPLQVLGPTYAVETMQMRPVECDNDSSVGPMRDSRMNTGRRYSLKSLFCYFRCNCSELDTNRARDSNGRQ